MRASRLTSAARLWALPILLATAFAAMAATVEEKRAEVREQSAAALQRLYAASPSARTAIEKSAGYATFSNSSLKLGIAGGGRGGGLAVDRASGREVFMRYLEVQAGVGAGVKKFDVVFVFETRKALQDFVGKGWEYSGQATAAAKSGGKGMAYSGAVSVSPGVWLYQVTSAGLTAELTIKGTKYYQDKALN